MRYWISRTAGEVEGPFDVPTLRAMLEEGVITSATQLCLEGTETWQPLRTVSALRTDAPPTDVVTAQELVETSPAPIDGKEFSIGNVFTLGWNCVLQNYGLILCMVLMWIGMSVVLSGLSGGLNLLTTLNAGQVQPIPVGGGWTNSLTSPWDFIGRIVEFLVITPYLLGVAIVIIRLLRGESMQWSDSWCAFRGGNYARVLLIQLCWLGLGVLFVLAVGLVIGVPTYAVYSMSGRMTSGAEALLIIGLGCVVPIAWYFYLRLGFTNFIVLDPRTQRPPLFECFKISWEATRGWSTVGSLFLIGICCIVISIITVLMCFLPFVLIGFPVIYGVVAAAYALLIANTGRFRDNNHCVHCGYRRSADSPTICSECGRPWREDPGASGALEA